MAMRTIEKRLELLEEKDKGDSGIVAIWIEDGDTVEQAIARRFNGQLPANTKFIIAGWDNGEEVRP